MSEKSKTAEVFYTQAVLLSKVIERLLKRKAGIRWPIKKDFELKPVSEFMKRMRVSSFDKFDTATYVSWVNLYASEEGLENGNTLGVIILYVEEEYVVDLMQKLEYPIDDYDDEELMEDASGTLCNLIAGNFKNGLTQIGYKELAMSHFSSYRNEVLNGVEYYRKQPNIYEITFTIGNEKRIVAELSLGPVPKV